MCRLLFVQSEKSVDIGEHLTRFANICKNGQEYQGHGWGCGYIRDGAWKLYKNLSPIWEDDLSKFGASKRLIAHARSAFQNKGIAIENNMPFFDPPFMFVFNGELHGVRIKESGRTGAEKIFNYLRRFDRGDRVRGFGKAIEIIQRRSKYVRAMNIILADENKAYVMSLFNEDPCYFTMHYKKENGQLIICSERYPNESNWQAIRNRTIEVF